MHRRLIPALLAVVALGLAVACEDDQPSAQQKETETQQSGYDRLTNKQPAKVMNYSPTRETINYWIETWNEPGKLAYVYLQASNGQLVGYYIFEGLPVSYCASLTPTYRIESHGGSVTTRHQVPAPAMDGVYYSGGECSTYYGKDAGSGSYMEYTVGTGINALVYEQPLPRQDIEPLGFTEVGEEDDGN